MAEAPDLDKTEVTKYLWEELKLLQDTTFKVWGNYVTFYVWSHGATS